MHAIGRTKWGWRFVRLAAVAALFVLPALSTSAGRGTASTPTACPPAWHTVATDNPGAGTDRLSAISARTAGDAWAVGYSIDGGNELPLVEHQDSSGWTGANIAGASAGDSRLTGVVAIAQDDAVAVGYTVKGDGTVLPLVERWNGTSWAASNPNAGTGDHRLFAVTATSGSDVTAVGSTTNDGATTPLVLRWNGSTWAADHPGAGAGDSSLAGVDALSSSDAVAVGTTTTALGKVPLVLTWNGSAWSPANPPAGPDDAELRAVAEVTSGDMTAVGVSTPPTGPAPLVMHWDGSSWTPSHPLSSGELDGVAAVGSGDIWAVGSTPGSPATTLALHWGGTSWTTAATPNGSGASALAGAAALGSLDVWAVGGDASATLAEHYQACAPSVATEAATDITQTGATLHASVIPNGLATDVHFEYGQTTAYGKSTSTTAVGSGTGVVPVPSPLTGLTPGTSYHYRVVAANGTGTTTGDDMSFTTDAIPAVSLTPTATSVPEGDTGSHAVTLTATLSAPSSQTVTAHWATADGTATAGQDYTGASGTVTFAPGDTTEPIVVNVLGDDIDEGNETFTVSLSAPVNATVTPPPATVTILDDDTKPSVTTGNASSVTQTAATLNGTVTPNGKATSYHFEYGTTTSYGQSTPSTGAGSGTTAVPVTASLTSLLAGTTYHARLVASSPAGTTNGADVTLTTAQPAIVLSPLSPSVNEGDSGSTPVAFTVALSAAHSQTISVAYATADGTATAGQDYTGAAGTLTFTPGTTSLPLTLSVLGDQVHESDETFTLTLSSPTNATISSGAATVTIRDDDTLPSATTGAATGVAETAATLHATVNPQGKPTTVTFDYGPTAAYGSTTPSQNAGSGTSAQDVSASLSGLDASTTYHYRVVAVSPAGTTTGADQVVTTADPTLAVAAPATIGEPDSPATVNVNITVALSSRSSQTVTVGYATVAGTATANEDFVATSGTLTFTPGQMSKTVPVTVNGDNVDEDDETFGLHLSAPTHATVKTADATVTILDNDPPASLSVADASVTEGTGGTSTLTFTVMLAPASGRTVTVDYATQDGTAVAPDDYAAKSGTLTFAKGETTKQVAVTVVGDSLYEADETLMLTLSNAVKAVIGDGTATGTIVNDDAKPALAISDQTVAEGDSGTASVTFAVSLCAPGTGGTSQPACAPATSGLPVTASYATKDGSAVAPDDYAAASGAITIAPGQKTASIAVQVAGDVLFETDETFTVDLSGVTGADAAKASAVGTITNDDPAPVVRVDDASAVEGGVATFTIRLCAPGTGGDAQPTCAPRAAGVPIAVNWAALPGTACGGNPPAFAIIDFQAIGGQRSFVPGDLTTKFAVQTIGNKVKNADKKFCGQIQIADGSPGTVARSMAIGTILDDDSPPTVSIDDVQVIEGDGGGSSATFTVSFSGPSSVCTPDNLLCGASVDWKTVDGSATAPADYTASSGTVTMDPPAEDFSYQLKHTVTVPIVGDALAEPNEQFTVVLSNAKLATIAKGNGTATILDDDAPPGVTTGAADGVAPTAATLNGTANPSSKATMAWFQYGPTTSYGSSTAATAVGADGASHTVSAGLSGLQVATTYHFRVVAANATGTTYGGDNTFTTPYPAPEAVTGAFDAVTAAGATLAGTARTFGQAGTAWFEYGPTTAYGSTTAKTPVSGAGDSSLSQTLAGLTQGTTYHYRAVVQVGDTVVTGDDATFRTLVATIVIPPPRFSASSNGQVSGTGVSVSVRCMHASPACRGSVAVDAAFPAAGSKRVKKLRVGEASFSSIRTGKTLAIRIRLARKAMAVLRKTHRLRVTVTVTVRDTGPAARKSFDLTLKM